MLLPNTFEQASMNPRAEMNYYEPELAKVDSPIETLSEKTPKTRHSDFSTLNYTSTRNLYQPIRPPRYADNCNLSSNRTSYHLGQRDEVEQYSSSVLKNAPTNQNL